MNANAQIAKRHTKKRTFDWFFFVIFVILFLYTASLLIPVIWTFLTSVKDNDEYTILDNILGWPSSWRWSNYATAYTNFYVPIQRNGQTYHYTMPYLFWNSILYSVGCAVAATITPCLVAYLCARYPFRFSKVVYAIVLVAMSLPIVGSLPSEIQMSKTLHFFDTFWGIWLMKANFLGIYFLVFYARFKTIPAAYSEAAKIDGASNTRVLWQVILPLAKDTLFTVFLLNFVTFWNDYQIPMVYLPSHPVAAYGMFLFQNSTVTEISYTPVKLAGILLMTLPILLISLIFSRRLMTNINVGGIKE